jgi:hypothetical protein
MGNSNQYCLQPMVEIDLTFAHTYEVEEIGDFPGTGRFAVPLLYFPPPRTRPEHNGLWLKVSPSGGKPWIGVFAFGYQSPPSISRVISSPDPHRVCVISKGGAYIVKVDQPEVWEEIPLIPVLDVRQIPENRLLVFSDFTRLAAYGIDGLAWRSPQVCWDGLKIDRVTRDTIEGTGYDPTFSVKPEFRFVVDLKTGRSLIPSPVSVDGKLIW